MCGIIGITQHGEAGSGKVIFDGLTRLEYRGYDSVGIAIVQGDQITVRKDKGAINEVGKKLNFERMEGITAIGHSRWATHGKPSKENAHPHLSMNGRVAVVHNGIIENFIELRGMLKEKGYVFKSDTDTEVIPNLMEHYLQEEQDVNTAIRKLIKTIEGTFAVVMVLLDDPQKIYTFRRDNPIVLGVGEGENYCASDIPAFLPYTNKVLVLRDDELAILTPDKISILDVRTWERVGRKPKNVNWTAEAAQKAGYPHFMLKEIHEQPRVLETQLKSFQESIRRGAELLSMGRVVLVAAGTAYHAGLSAYYLMPKYMGKPVIPCVAAEWETICNIIDDDTLVITCSQSGETLDTIIAVKDAKERGAKILAFVNVVDSTLTRVADEVVYIHSGPEIGVAATKTYTTMDYAIWRVFLEHLKMNRKLEEEAMKKFENAIISFPETIATLVRKYEAKSQKIAKRLKDKSSIYYLGRGIGYAAAREGALKLKEISYIHAEAFPAGESKHGPIALIEEDFPVVFFIPNDETRDKMMGSVQEMKARGAYTIGIIEEGDKEMMEVLDEHFEIPSLFSRYLVTGAYQIPAQFLAYYTSVYRGFNPDMPRNLAKSVTVL